MSRMRVEDIEEVAIIGFGVMGRQIAQLLTQYGIRVSATDLNEDVLERGLEAVKKGRFGLDRAVKRGKMTEEEANRAFSRISVTSDMAEICQGADFVIEAVNENLDLKKEVFKELDRICPGEVVLATNTSTLSITEIASTTSRPGRVVGMHFFNPPQIMKLVEIVQGTTTTRTTVELTRRFSLRMGKTPILVSDSPGFVTSRLGCRLYLEASRILEENVASIRDIDLGMKLGYGHPMGPFELVDLVGLDARLRNLEALRKATGDPRWDPPALLRRLVTLGYLGDSTVKPGSKGGYYRFFKLPGPMEEEP